MFEVKEFAMRSTKKKKKEFAMHTVGIVYMLSSVLALETNSNNEAYDKT